MKKIIESWANFVVKHRIFVILGTIILVGTLFLPMKGLFFNNSDELWFVTNDPDLVNYRVFKERFGADDYIVVGLEGKKQDKNIFNAETLKVISEISTFLEDHKDIDKVVSISNYQYIHADEDVLQVDRIVPEELEDLSSFQIEEMLQIMQKETIIHDRIIAKDFRHTLILGRLVKISEDNSNYVRLVHDLKKFIADQKYQQKGWIFHYFGNPAVSEALFTLSMHDSNKIHPLMFLMLIILLLLFFRTITGLFMPLIVVAGAIITTFGILGLSGWGLNPLTISLNLLIIAVGIGDAIHIITKFYKFRAQGLESKAAAVESLKHLFIPCFYTSLTTVFGFMAISVSSHIAAIREFGILAMIGITMAFILSVTIMPALLSLIPGKDTGALRIVENSIVTRLTAKLLAFNVKNHKSIIVVALIFILASLLMTTTISLDTGIESYFKPQDKIRMDLDYADKIYKAGSRLEIMLDSGKGNGLKDPDYLNHALEFQNYLEQKIHMGKVNSYLNYLCKMNQTMHNNDPAYYKIPLSSELIAQYLLLYTSSGPNEDLSDLKTFDNRYMRISVNMKMLTSFKTNKEIKAIRDILQKDFKNLNGVVTGTTVLDSGRDKYVLTGLLKSFSLAVILITLCFLVIFRSIKYGILVLLPSLFPIVFAGGIMGISGINLDLPNMIIAAIIFGITVDDSIHFMTHYLNSRRQGDSIEVAIQASIRESGQAIIFTSLILFLSFSILALSAFVPNVHMGVFSALIVLVALFATLILLPAILLGIGKRAQRGCVGVDVE
ncbi:MAG: MMPL family transporter [bacterium]